MYPWISRTLDLWLQFCEKKCGLYMDVYGNRIFELLNRSRLNSTALTGAVVIALMMRFMTFYEIG